MRTKMMMMKDTKDHLLRF